MSLGLWLTASESTRNGRVPVQWGSTPAVVGPDDNADSLLMEVAGSLRLFGGLSALLEAIRRLFAGRTFAGRTAYRERPNLSLEHLQPLIAVAPVPAAALLLARNGREVVVRSPGELRSVLGDIPVSGADVTAKRVAELGRCGIDTLRDLWRLPAEDLGRRFGRELLEYLDRLTGERPEPVVRMEAIPRFRQRLALPADTRDSGMILLAAEKLLAGACRFLERHAAAAEEVVFDLWHVHRGRGERDRSRIRLVAARAARRPDHFLAQLETRLERLGRDGAASGAQGGGRQRRKSGLVMMPRTVEAVSIRVDRVLPYRHDSQDLFQRRQDGQPEWEQLVDLLTARLGREQVCRLHPVADHRPERATDRQWAGESPAEFPGAVSCHRLPTRPLWLLESPRPIRRDPIRRDPIRRDPIRRDLLEGVRAAVDEVPEVERIEAGWWERGDVRRDYMTATLDRGALGWVFRDLRAVAGSGGHSGNAGNWHLHGLFG